MMYTPVDTPQQRVCGVEVCRSRRERDRETERERERGRATTLNALP